MATGCWRSGEPGKCAFKLGPGELAEFSRLERSQLQRAVRHSFEPRDFVGERGEHPADFAVLAFGKPDGQVGLLAAGFAQDDCLRLELFSRVQQSPSEPLKAFLR